MKPPTWGTVIGILMIVFGGCSVLNNLQKMKIPDKIEERKAQLQKKLDESKSTTNDSIAENSLDSTKMKNDKQNKNKEFAKSILNMSEFTKTWIVRFSFIGIFVSIIYILSGFFLLKPQRFSIKLAYGALILSIVCSGLQIGVLTTGESTGIIALVTGGSQLLSIMIDIILLSVIFASDKEAYQL